MRVGSLRFEGDELLALRFHLLVCGCDGFLAVGNSFRQAADVAGRAHELLRQRRFARVEALAHDGAVFRALAERRELRRHGIDLFLELGVLLAFALHRLLDGDDARLHAFFFRFGGRLRGLGRRFLVLGALLLRFRRRPLASQRVVALVEARQMVRLVLALERLVRARLLGVRGERAELSLDLLLDVADAHEVLLRVVELLQRLALARLVLRDTGRLLEECAALLRAAVQDVVDAVLPDDAHALVADARVGEQLVNVLDAAARAVEEHFALAAAVQAARDDDFGEIDGQRAVRVVEDKRNLGDAELFARRRAGENDVFGFCGAQVSDVLLAEHPADGVGDVALAAAVRADDGRDARVKLDDDLIGKRLEAVGFETFELHERRSLCLEEMLFELRRARVRAHEVHEPVVDGRERLVRAPVQRDVQADGRLRLAVQKDFLAARDEFRQHGNARTIGDELFDRLELRRREHDVRREAMLRATVKDAAVLEIVRLLHDEFFMAQAAERHDVKRAERMMRRQAELHLVAHDEELVLDTVIGAREHDAEIELAEVGLLTHFERIAELLHVERDVRIRRAEFRKEIREQVALDHRRDAEADRAARLAVEALHVLIRRLHVAHDALRVDEERAPFLRELHVLLAAVDERELQLALERFDGLRHGRLRDVQHLGRAREVLELADRDEIFQLSKFHGTSPS